MPATCEATCGVEDGEGQREARGNGAGRGKREERGKRVKKKTRRRTNTSTHCKLVSYAELWGIVRFRIRHIVRHDFELASSVVKHLWRRETGEKEGNRTVIKRMCDVSKLLECALWYDVAWFIYSAWGRLTIPTSNDIRWDFPFGAPSSTASSSSSSSSSDEYHTELMRRAGSSSLTTTDRGSMLVHPQSLGGYSWEYSVDHSSYTKIYTMTKITCLFSIELQQDSLQISRWRGAQGETAGGEASRRRTEERRAIGFHSPIFNLIFKSSLIHINKHGSEATGAAAALYGQSLAGRKSVYGVDSVPSSFAHQDMGCAPPIFPFSLSLLTTPHSTLHRPHTFPDPFSR